MVASENFQAVDTPTVRVYSFLQVISSIRKCAVELWSPVLSEFNSAYASTQMSRKIAKICFGKFSILSLNNYLKF